MNLKRFNTITAPAVRQIGECTLNLNARNGVASLTNAAVEALAIVPTDKLELVQDADRPQDWYLAKSELGFPLRKHTAGGNGHVQFSCRAVIRAMLASLNLPPDATIRVNVDPAFVQAGGMALYPLATRGATVKMI